MPKAGQETGLVTTGPFRLVRHPIYLGFALLTMGESWHNNHHAYPESARLGLKSNEWDFGWWVLRLLQRIGLVWNVATPETLPARRERITLGDEPAVSSPISNRG